MKSRMPPNVYLFDYPIPSRSSIDYKCVFQLLEGLVNRDNARGKLTIDLFCGDSNKKDLPFRFDVTNDVDFNKQADRHLDALCLLRTLESGSCSVIFADPPFNQNQSIKKFGRHGTNIDTCYMNRMLDEIERVLSPDGHAVLCGFDGHGCPPPLDAELILVCCGGGEKTPMVVTVSTRTVGNLPPLPFEGHQKVELLRSEGPLLTHPDVRQQVQQLLSECRWSIMAFDCEATTLDFTQTNSVERRPHREDLAWLSTFSSQSVDFVACSMPTIQHRGRMYQKYKMLFTNEMKRTLPTSTGYAAKVKDNIARIVKPGGHILWMSECPGVGFKARGGARIRVFMKVRGLGHNAQYATLIRQHADTGYALKRVKRQSVASRSLKGNRRITEVWPVASQEPLISEIVPVANDL